MGNDFNDRVKWDIIFTDTEPIYIGSTSPPSHGNGEVECDYFIFNRDGNPKVLEVCEFIPENIGEWGGIAHSERDICTLGEILEDLNNYRIDVPIEKIFEEYNHFPTEEEWKEFES